MYINVSCFTALQPRVTHHPPLKVNGSRFCSSSATSSSASLSIGRSQLRNTTGTICLALALGQTCNKESQEIPRWWYAKLAKYFFTCGFLSEMLRNSPEVGSQAHRLRTKETMCRVSKQPIVTTASAQDIRSTWFNWFDKWLRADCRYHMTISWYEHVFIHGISKGYSGYHART